LITSVKKSNVPESVPGPNRLSCASGSLGSISLRLLTLEPWFQSFLSWSVVRQSTFSSGFVTTAIPSFATWTSL
jgi:hypothetical protein